MSGSNPGSKLSSVGDCGTQECHPATLRGQDDALFPHHSTLCISQVVHLIIHQQANLTNNLCSTAAKQMFLGDNTITGGLWQVLQTL